MLQTISESLILAFALAVDALTVSFSYGLILNGNRFINAFKFAFMFGFFQFFMPVLGWYFTDFVSGALEKYSKILVFTVFMFLALKIFKDAFEQEKEVKTECITFGCLLILATATSIDAFFAGISIKMMNLKVLYPALLIGCVTFILSFSGFIIANKMKHIPKKALNITGAILLSYLALKALF